MNVIDFADDVCRRIQRYRDSYISGELLVETSLDVQRHLDACPRCADDFADAARLRKAVRDDARREQAPEGLRERIQTGIRQERKARRWSAGIAIAAALLLVVAGGWTATIFVSGHAPHELIAQERYIDSLVDRVGAVTFLGLSDHLHCGVYWKILQRRLDEADIERDLGPRLAPLAALVQRRLPAGYDVRLAHRCDYRGRTYIHFAAQGKQEDELVSVILTERTAKDSFTSSDGLRPVTTAAGVEIFGTGVDGYELAGFELAGYIGFVVSALAADENRAITEALLPSVNQFMSGLRG